MGHFLTNPQNSIWLTEKFFKGTSVNNICGYVYIKDEVDFDVLKKSINELVKTNDSMRFKFKEENGACVQYENDYKDFDIEMFNFSSEKDIEKKALEMANEPFDFENSFLFKFILFKLPNNSGGFIVNVHHIIGDSWTLGLIAKEVTGIYSALLNNTYEEKQFPSYINYINNENEYINSEKYIKDKAYWDEVFGAVPEVASIPSMKDSKNIAHSCKGAREKFIVPEKEISKIKEFCTNNKISVYNFFMAVYSLYLGRVSNLDDFVVGTPILNRTNFEQKHTMGMFISTAPLRINLDHELSFIDFSKNIASNSMSLLRHQRYPYQAILEELRKKDASIPNLYNMVLSYQITKTVEEENNIRYTTDWVFNGNSADELQIHLFDLHGEDSMTVAYDYKFDKYDSQDIKDLHARILTIINQVIDNNDVLLKNIEIVTPEEKHKILYEFNDTTVDYPRDKTIVDLFEEQVEKTPDNIAVVFEDQKLTYRELNEKANQLAHYLVDNNVKDGDIVAILLDKSLEVIVSMFAILKCGASFLPLDIDYPEDRLEYILNNSNPKLILSSKNIDKTINDFNILNIDLDNKEIYNNNTSNLNLSITPENIMYVMYTSGSTGNPKGVMVKHKNITRLAMYPNFIEFAENEVMIQTGTIVFDACIFEIFGSLLHGFKLYIIKKEKLLDIEYFSKFLEEKRVSILFLTTGLFNHLGLQNPNMFKNLKYLLTGGDVISTLSVKNILNNTKNLKIINCYGPTENGSYSTCYQITGNEENIPIGKPITNSSAYIVNEFGNLCPIGIPGELWVAGDGVAKGYLNNEALTNESFIKNPFGNDNIYKTGDLVKYLPNGNIEFIGRIDNQVKIRGFRIELSEIDTNILKYPDIKQAVSVVQNINNTKTICSYIVSDKNIDIGKLKGYLSKTLANYMIPTYIVKLDNLPLNINGKVDRKALPLPNINETEKKIVPARNNIDKVILTNLKKFLSTEKISIEDNLFDIGIDSLSAITLSSNISKELNIQITVKDIFEHSIIKDLSDYISTLSGTRNINRIKKAEKKEYYPLSSAQKRIYYTSSLDNNSTLYNVAGGIILDKNLDIDKLEQCFNVLINRHEVLRTSFEIKDNDIVQIIKDEITFKLEVEKSSSDNLNNVYSNFVKPFELSKAPLFRAKVIKLEDEKMLLLIDMHHIISDGTSLSILLQELCDLYNDNELSEKQIDYTDFTLWEKEQFEGDEFKNSKEFWVNSFKDEIPLLNMPTNNPRPSVQSFEGSNYYTNLSKETFNRIEKLSKDLGVTPYMLMLSCYYILLSKYTSQDDIVIGTPIVGRELPELSNMLGMFVNTLALRNKIDSSLSFNDFANTIKEHCLEAFKNQAYPFDMLVKDLDIKRDTSRNPLFDVMFIYQNNGYPEINFKDAKAEYFIPDNNVSKFDLSLEVIPTNNEYSLRFEYCTKLFNEDFIKRLSSHYINILNAILENTEIKIADIDMLSEEERNQILYEFNNTKVDYPKDKTIIDLFEKQVKKTPDNIAVVFEDQELTYKELNEKANQLARYFLNNNIEKASNVAILLPRSVDTIISILAILKIGCSYLLVDSSLPKGRIEYMLTNANSSVLLTYKDLNITYENTIYLESFSSELYDNQNLNINSNPSDVFALLYTSGSTGTPKGIMLHNIGMINVVLAHRLYMNTDICNNFLSYSSVSFDMFQVETYVPLLNGKKIILANEEEKNTPSSILNLIRKHEINFILSTPSKIKLVLDCCDTVLDSLKVIQLGGEVLTDNIIHQIRTLSSATIYNAYGPSEITACCTVKEVGKNNIINIGKPICNTKIIILNKDLGLCPIGVPGELCIFGDGVSYGYINNTDLTTKSFIKNKYFNTISYRSGDIAYLDSNLDINYIGRQDKQIKLRGLRIELSEIESKIASFDNIDNCCVICKNNEYLSAFIVSKIKIDTKELKSYLKNNLPLYMVPRYITQIDSIPISNNGKIDRISLENYKENIPEDRLLVTPQNNKEKTCCKIWSDLLKTKVNPLDDVFELGADSLLAIKFKTQMLANNINVSYSNIFKYPVIRDFCAETFFSKDKQIDNYNYSKINKLLENNNIKNLKHIEKSKKNNVLLLGANGFIGMHIIDSFIKKDKGNIYCIVRDKNKTTAQQRFMDTLHFYFGNKLDKYINKRIFILKGNILKENFELSNTNINMLSNNIDVVINAAALVKHYGKESLFNEINIGSTRIAIQFCESFKKKFIHISSLSVSGNDVLHDSTSYNPLSENMSFSENSFYIGQDINNVYTKSKFEAEKIILEHILSNSLNAQILRLGNITSRLSDGKFQINPSENAFVNKLKSLIQLKHVPNTLLSSYMEFTPVDICANAIVLIMQNYISNFNVFHIYDNNHVYINDFIKMLNKLNIQCSIISEEEFSSLIKEKASSNFVGLDGIINDLTEDNKLYYNSNIHIYSEFSRAVLYRLGFIWPKIDAKYIKKYIKYLYDIDFFKEE